MMLTPLKQWLKEEKKDKTIFDIVLYGSSVKGKENPKDIDLVVIFREGTLKERLEKIQHIKRKIILDIPVDIKSVLWYELFADEFFARTGILTEGISVFDGKSFSLKLGFRGFTLFTYSLQAKSHTEKIKFNYVLRGRTTQGMIKNLGGEHIAPGAILIPIGKSLEFEEVLKMHAIKYKIKNILMS